MNTIYTYLNFLIKNANLPLHCYKTFKEIFPYINKEKEIYLDKTIKKRIANKLNVGLDFINKDISLLKSANIIESVSKGRYKLSDKYFIFIDMTNLNSLIITITIKDNETNFCAKTLEG